MSALKPLSIGAIRAAAARTTDSLALLPQGFERFAKHLGKSCGSLMSAPPHISYESFAPVQGATAFADTDGISFMLDGSVPPSSMRVTMDRPLVFGLCDLLLGGVGNEAPFAEDRPISKIEHSLARLLASEVGAALPEAFPPGAAGAMMPRTRPADEMPPFKAAARISFLCTLQGYSGEMLLDLPDELLKLFTLKSAVPHAEAGKPAVDTIAIDLTAVLADMPMSVDEVGKLARGQLIRLNATAQTPVKVQGGEIELFRARLGQHARKYCLAVI
jgi:flagellar motor switch protein FliM